MISEKTFAIEFPGFWAECLPFLTPQFIIGLNRTGAAKRDKRLARMRPLADSGDNSNNDVTAEAAFGLFVESLKQRRKVLELCKEPALIQKIEAGAKSRVLGLWQDGAARPQQTSPATSQAVELATRLESYFKEYPSSLSTFNRDFEAVEFSTRATATFWRKGTFSN